MVQVLEGEASMTAHCNLRGKFELSGIPPAPRGVPQIEVTFDIDANGILNVSAEDKATNKKNKITITNDKGLLSKEWIERTVADAEKNMVEDDARKEKIEARNQLENFCNHVKNMAGEQLGDKMSAEDKAAIEEISKDEFEWLDAHQDASKAEVEGKMNEVEGVIRSIVAKAYQQAGACLEGCRAGSPAARALPECCAERRVFGDEGPVDRRG